MGYILPKRAGGAGGGGATYVEALPEFDDADESLLYVRTSDNTMWRFVEAVTTEAAAAFLTSSEFVTADDSDYQGAYDAVADIPDGTATTQYAFVAGTDGLWRRWTGSSWASMSPQTHMDPSLATYYFPTNWLPWGRVLDDAGIISGGHANFFNQFNNSEDDEAAVVAIFEGDDVTYDATKTYLYYDDELEQMRKITGFTVAVEEEVTQEFQGLGGSADGFSVKKLWSGDIDITTASEWKAAGTMAVPDSASWLLWNGGTKSGGDDDGPTAQWTWIWADDWRSLTADTADTTPDDGTGMLLVEWVADDVGGGSPDFDRRDVVIGRTAANVPLLTSKDANEDLYGASIFYTVSTPAKQINITGLDGIELKDVTDTHGPGEAEEGDRKVEFDFSAGRVWMSRQERQAATAAQGGGTDVLVSGHFKGARLIHPTLPAENDYYYSYRNGAHHWWDYIIHPTYGGVWSGVEYAFIAERKAAFDTGSVFLGERFDAAAAAAAIDDFDTTKSYYFYSLTRSRIVKMTNSAYVAGTNEAVIASYNALTMGAYVPPETAYWYIAGQTSRWPSSYAYTTQPASNRLRLQWTGGNPDESPYGWDQGSIWVDGDDVNAGIDGSANPAVATDDVVFSPEPGIYDIEVTMGTSIEQIDTEEFGVFLYKIASGVDDEILASSSGRVSNLPASFGGTGGTIFRMEAPDIAIAASEELYVLTFSTSTTGNRRGFLKLVKKA